MHDKSYFKEESGREAQEGGDICVCVCVCVNELDLLGIRTFFIS